MIITNSQDRTRSWLDNHIPMSLVRYNINEVAEAAFFYALYKNHTI